MTLDIVVNILGGLALFLLAMAMMTDGLTDFAGNGLKTLLGRWTSTPLRGVGSGIVITGLVQSSSAVTVATIGFVNAGVLTLRQALGVIFGTNIGTTITAWLVSLVGLGIRIDAFALPILTVGVVLRLLASRQKWKGLGLALAGFGLFFLGLDILKDAFGGLAAGYGASLLAAGSWPTFVLAGFVATVLTQSSSAAIAIILTAATGGVVGMEGAAAAVIGANLGTTSTAAIAVLQATPAAKRLALGHIAFNLVTGVIALAMLPSLMWLVDQLGRVLQVENSPAAVLAMFHTVFNTLGVVLMLPLAGRMATLLERMFQQSEEDIGRPRHLDTTLVATPALAAAALREELLRLDGIVTDIARSALSGGVAAPGLARQVTAVRSLGDAIAAFVAQLRTESMPADVATDFAGALYAARYLREAARLAPSMRVVSQQSRQLAQLPPGPPLAAALAAARHCLPADPADPAAASPTDAVAARNEALEDFQRAYGQAKQAVLEAAVAGQLTVEATDGLLDDMTSMRRAVEQLVKAGRLLHARRLAQPLPVEMAENGAAGT